MTITRIAGLGLIVLGACVLLTPVSCDSTDTKSTQGGGNPGVGGDNAGGGTTAGTSTNSKPTGGSTLGTGGVKPTGGAPNDAGGDGSAGCTPPAATKAANCGTPTVASGSFVVSNGNYFKLGSYSGYGFDYISPTKNSADSVTCSNSTFGSGKLTALCGAGVVPADCNFDAVGGVGFNLAQPSSGGDPAPAITMTVHQVVVTFTNTAATDLHIQVVQYDGTTLTNYCYEAKGKNGPLTLSASDFTTSCFTADNPGAAWDGTGAESFQFIVPSRSPEEGDTPFDLCIQNVEFS